MSYSYKVNKNQIKYTLQKGKILDMPLQEPYTEAGNNLDSGTLTIGKIYIITAHDTKDFTADGAPNNNIGTIFTATSSTVTLDVDNMVKELNSVAKDKTPNNNNGTINGTIITYNGLVNNTAGVAYITLKRQNTYQFRVKYQNTGITLMFAAQNIYGSTGYGIRLNTDGKLQLYKDNNSIAETAIDYLINNTNYQFKITWSQSGEFVVYIKGGSYGLNSWTTVITYTDTTYDDCNYFVIDATANCEINDLQVL